MIQHRMKTPSRWHHIRDAFVIADKRTAELQFARADIERLKADNVKLGESVARLLAEKAQEQETEQP